MEVMVGMSIAAILSLAIANNTITSLRTAHRTEAHHAASRLASDKLEELAAIDSIVLDDTYDLTENSVSYPGINATFTRVTDVTINADDTRSISVTVTSNNALLSAEVEFETTFALWE